MAQFGGAVSTGGFRFPETVTVKKPAPSGGHWGGAVSTGASTRYPTPQSVPQAQANTAALAQAQRNTATALNAIGLRGKVSGGGGGFWDSAIGKILSSTTLAGQGAKTVSDIISGHSDKVAKDAVLTVTHALPGNQGLQVASALGGTKPAKDLARSANKLAAGISPKDVTFTSTGAGPGVAIGAGVGSTGGKGPALGVAIAHPPQGVVTKVLSNAAKEAISIPGNLPTNVALTAQHPGTALKQFVTTDPIITAIRTGSTKPLIEHPLSAALDVSGTEGLLGRGLGIGARGAGATARALGASEGSRLGRLGSVKRPSLQLYHGTTGGPSVPRSYSLDLLRKQGQKGLDAAKRAQGKDPNLASSLYIAPKARARFMVGKRVDEEAAMGEGVRRAERGQTKKFIHQTFKPVPKSQHPAVALAVGKILRSPETVAQDLRTFHAKASGADVSNLDKAGMAQRGDTLKHVERLLNNEKFLANPQKVFQAAEKVIPNEKARTEVLIRSGLLKPEEANAAHILYGVTHMEGVRPSQQHTLTQPLYDAKGNEIAGSRKQRPFFLEDQHGREVTPEQVKAHMAQNGVAEPGFFSQQVNTRNVHFIPSTKGGKLARQTMPTQRRSGTATQTAAFDISKQAVEESAVKTQGYVSAVEQLDHQLTTFGVRKPLVANGKVIGKRFWGSWDQATRAGNEFATEPSNPFGRYVPANVGRLSQVHDLLGGAVHDEQVVSTLSKVIQDTFKDDPGNRGQYVLVPEFVAKRLLQHANARGPLDKYLGNLQRIFKETVLATSTKWHFGNVADITLRSAANTIGPVRIARGIKVLRDLQKVDPKAAEQLRQRTVGGTLFGSHEGTTTFKEPSAVANAPFIKQARGGWNVWKKAVFGFDAWYERIPQYGAMGKIAAQEIHPTMDGVKGFLKFGGKAFDQYVQGLRGTTEQVRTARYVEDVVGRWGKLSPTGKRLVLDAFPFGQWAKVALKFVYYTLPAKHPVKTAVIAELNNMNEQERKKLGIDIFQVPGFLGGSIPTKGGNIRAQNYTSFGVPSAGPQGLANFLLPQYMGIYRGLQGQNWKGQPLKDKHGKPITDLGRQLWLGANQQAESMVPLLSLAHRLREGGGSGYDTSTVFSPQVRPGTYQGFGAALNKQFNPFRPIPKRQSSSGDSSGGGSTATGQFGATK